MSIDHTEIQRRTKVALDAIKSAYGTDEDDFGATLFVSHHLAEIDCSYWEDRFQTASPQPSQILDALILLNDFDEDEDEDMNSLDFTLPGDITDYLLCVTFDESGQVEAISMES